MTNIPHLSALRRGRPYQSLDRAEVKDFRTGKIKAQVSQVAFLYSRRAIEEAEVAA